MQVWCGIIKAAKAPEMTIIQYWASMFTGQNMPCQVVSVYADAGGKEREKACG